MKIPAWRPNMTQEEKHERHIIRLYRQGVRFFRVGPSPTALVVEVLEIDMAEGKAQGRTLKGRNRSARLVDLYPMEAE